MKSIVLFILTCLVYINVNAQTTTATPSGTLLTDQNPNYQRSRDKYMAESATLTKNEGVTIQETYKAIDDVQAKKDRRALASERRHERRMARIESRSYRRRIFNNNRFNNGFNDNFYNYGYYNNPYGFYSPQYYSNNIYRSGNTVLNTALFGLAVWSLFRR